MRTPVEINLIISVILIKASDSYFSSAYDVKNIVCNTTGTPRSNETKNDVEILNEGTFTKSTNDAESTIIDFVPEDYKFQENAHQDFAEETSESGKIVTECISTSLPVTDITEPDAFNKKSQNSLQFSKPVHSPEINNGLQKTNSFGVKISSVNISTTEKLQNFPQTTLEESQKVGNELSRSTESPHYQVVMKEGSLLHKLWKSQPEQQFEVDELLRKKLRTEELKNTEFKISDNEREKTNSFHHLSRNKYETTMSDHNIKFYRKLPHLIAAQVNSGLLYNDQSISQKPKLSPATRRKKVTRNSKRDLNSIALNESEKYSFGPTYLDSETDAEKEAKFNKALEKFTQVVNFFGEMDSYVSTRLKNTIKKLAKLCEEDGPLI